MFHIINITILNWSMNFDRVFKTVCRCMEPLIISHWSLKEAKSKAIKMDLKLIVIVVIVAIIALVSGDFVSKWSWSRSNETFLYVQNWIIIMMAISFEIEFFHFQAYLALMRERNVHVDGHWRIQYVKMKNVNVKHIYL